MNGTGKLKVTFVWICTILMVIATIKVVEDSPESRSVASRSQYVAQLHRTESKRDVTIKAQLLPDAHIFGIHNCGTSAVQFFMDMHPQLHVDENESEFFTTHFDEGLDFYDDKYAMVPASKLIIEKSTNYWSFRGQDVVQKRIKNTYAAYGKGVKLILVACDPALRTVTQYAHQSHNKNSVMSLEGYKSFLYEMGYLPDPRSNKQNPAPPLDAYDIVMPFWLRHFSRYQIHVVDGEKLKENPFEEMKLLERFLGLDDFIREDMFKFEPSKGFYCKVFEGQSVCMRNQKGGPHPEVPDEIMRRLRQRYRTHNYKFAKLANRQFDWTWNENMERHKHVFIVSLFKRVILFN